MFIIVSDYYIKYRQNSIKLMVGYRHITLLSDIIKRQLPYALMIPLITFSLASYYYFINAIKPAFNIAIFATLLGLTVLLLTYLLIASFLIFYPLNSRSSKGESPQKKTRRPLTRCQNHFKYLFTIYTSVQRPKNLLFHCRTSTNATRTQSS
ncbi:hypothetical protein BTHER_10159 [Brochothrix thermosphacta DSM 20171 = FSL F6-1036]|nr:hypothetical protein BTHER_10159 [Brochothrix thermosphacta DSM 20171 = FSL F6-1036]